MNIGERIEDRVVEKGTFEEIAGFIGSDLSKGMKFELQSTKEQNLEIGKFATTPGYVSEIYLFFSIQRSLENEGMTICLICRVELNWWKESENGEYYQKIVGRKKKF